jgi:FkbM family methyltransferase
MFSFFIQCIKNFGAPGLLVYLKVKLGLTKQISIPGFKFPITMRPTRVDGITFREIFIKREYDIELPTGFSPTVIVDAGANIGFTTLFFANRFPHARIFSIEPDEENFTVLSENAKPYSNITPIRSALWNKNEIINTVDRGYGKRGIMIDKNEGNSPLQSVSINGLMKEFNMQHIDILKMDIEGSEKEVFSENYDNWLPHTKCIVIELHDRMKEGCSKTVFTALSKYNFSLAIKGENLVFFNDHYMKFPR